MKLTDDEIRAIAKRIGDRLHPQRIILFGSYADGTAGDESDVDLLVVTDTDVPRYQYRAMIRRLLWPPAAPMDILIYKPEENTRWNGVPNHVVTSAMERGKVLYAA